MQLELLAEINERTTALQRAVDRRFDVDMEGIRDALDRERAERIADARTAARSGQAGTEAVDAAVTGVKQVRDDWIVRVQSLSSCSHLSICERVCACLLGR